MSVGLLHRNIISTHFCTNNVGKIRKFSNDALLLLCSLRNMWVLTGFVTYLKTLLFPMLSFVDFHTLTGFICVQWPLCLVSFMKKSVLENQHFAWLSQMYLLTTVAFNIIFKCENDFVCVCVTFFKSLTYFASRCI